MKTCYLAVLATFALVSIAAAQAIPAKRYVPDFSTTNPYGLVDLDSFGDDYNYCRWGNVMSENSGILPYTRLTEFKDELFLNVGKLNLKPITPESVGYVQDAPNRRFKWAKINVGGPDANYALFRKLHFPRALRDEVAGEELSSNTQISKVVVVIHGWNRGSDVNPYTGNFQSLRSQLITELQGSGWKLVFYDWATDADTGDGFDSTPPFYHSIDAPVRAAEIAHLHGQHLGELLATIAPNGKLQKVHFITHSAGAWAGRAAARYLLTNTYAKVQLTLLDPFMPEQLVGSRTALVNSLIGQLPSLDPNGSGQLVLLENYYALDDGTGLFDPTSNVFFDFNTASDGLVRATSQRFDYQGGWRAKDVTQRVDWQYDTVRNDDWYFKRHDGPVEFYYDTIVRPNLDLAILDTPLLRENPGGIGWSRSMFYQEPEISLQPSSPPPVAVGQSVVFRSGAALRGTHQFDASIQFYWERWLNNKWQPADGATNSPVYSIDAVTPDLSGAQYRLRISNDAGIDVSNTVTISLANASQPAIPAAPENLAGSAASATRNDLTWINRATNQTGLTVQRGLGSGGPWTTIASLTQAAIAFSDLAPTSDRPNFYRVGSYNSTNLGSPSWSNVVVIGGSSTSSSHLLTINSMNPSSSAAMALIPADLNGESNGTTPSLQRTYKSGASVAIVAALSASGSPFLKWQIDGADNPSSSNVIQFKMDRNHILTAIYGNAGTARSLAGLSIAGPSALSENTSQSYAATAVLSDGGSLTVSPVWSLNSGASASITNTGVVNAGAVSANTLVTLTATYSFGGVTKTASQAITINNSTTTQAYRLTLNYDFHQGGIDAPARGSIAAGTRVHLVASPNDGFHFTGWNGDASGTAGAIDVVMDSDKSVGASFATGDARQGTLTVKILPAAAAAAGATWGFSADDHRASDATAQSYPGSYWITFHAVDGWLAPPDQVVTLTAGATTVAKPGVFTADPTPGILSVTLSPPAAVAAGAKWHVNGGPAQTSGANVSLPPQSACVVTFDAATGWAAPSSQTVDIRRGQTAVLGASYSPPSGQPAISTVSPPVGALAGGTVLTIQGYNFTPSTTVTIGGQAATQVTVVSSSTVTCVTPKSQSYGTAPVLVTTANGSATSANGFAYGIPRGNGITLTGSIGGNINALAVQGNYSYTGEGSTLLVLDISTPSSPSPVARLALPGLIDDLAPFTSGGKQYLAVANDDSGLQIVDISDPAHPALRSYFATDGRAGGVAISGSAAIVAFGGNSDTSGGMMTISLTDPIHPKLLGTLALGFCDRVAVQASGASTIAYVSAAGGLAAVNITAPATPVLGLKTAPSTDWYAAHSLAILGNRAFLTGMSRLQAYDVSTPLSPAPLGAMTDDAPCAVSTAGGKVYTWGSTMSVYNVVNGALQVIGNRLVGNTQTFVPAAMGHSMPIVNGYAYCAGGGYGLIICSVADPVSMSIAGRYSATAGSYISPDFAGSNVFTSTEGTGLKQTDLTNPASPVAETGFVPSFAAGTGGDKTVISGNRLYLLAVGQLNILDITNHNQPVSLGSTSQNNYFINDFYVTGDTVVAGGDVAVGNFFKPAVFLLDISNPQSIALKGTVTYPNAAQGVRAVTGSDNTAYAAVALPIPRDTSLAVIDFTDRSNPRQIGQIPNMGDVQSRCLRSSPDGTHLFAGGFVPFFSVLDVGNPAAPSVVSTVATDSTIFGVEVSGHYVLLASQSILVYDVMDPAAPHLVRQYSMPSVSRGLRVDGSKVYVGGSTGGLSILSLADADAPLVAITAPTAVGTITVTSASTTLGGTASDATGLVPGSIARVSWSNDRGGGGSATGLETWTVSNIALAPGDNHITVTALDSAGNAGTATLVVNYTVPDSTPPAVNILTPSRTRPAETDIATVDILGNSSDNVGVASVRWSNARGGEGIAVGTSNWSVSGLSLQPGPNPITITATDVAGNTASATLNVTYNAPDTTSPTLKIQFPVLEAVYSTDRSTVSISGVAADESGLVKLVSWSTDQNYQGVATGTERWSANNIPLKPGMNSITVKAQDRSGNVTREVLNVTYTPLPAVDFLGLTGQFVGLTSAGDGGGALLDAVAKFQVGRLGTFTGTIGYGNATYAIHGRFAADGTYSTRISRGRLSPLTVVLYLGTDGAESISGSITDGRNAVSILSDHALVGSAKNPVAQMGRYTLLLQPAIDSDTEPQGFGYGSATVDATGVVRFAGTLPDGVKVTQATSLSSQGVWQFYVATDATKGRISGPVLFRSMASSDLDGILGWTKPAIKSAKLFPSGFDLSVVVEGSVYIAPPLQPQIFPAGTATLSIEGGNLLSIPSPKVVNVDTSNHVKITGSEKFSFTITPATGLFTGVFLDTELKTHSFSGAILQKQDLGVGIFSGPHQTGSVVLAPGSP
jgi:hypothetical protein